MIIEKVNINLIKLNPINPRIIKDDKFKKLVKSIKDFPQMLEIRPIVVDELGYVLGGNMRFKACKEAGLIDIFIIKTSGLTEEQKKEFIIKDNANFGEWDWEVLNIDWNMDDLSDWGLDITTFGNEQNSESEDEEDFDNSNAIYTQKWFLNIEFLSEKDCQTCYENLKKQG